MSDNKTDDIVVFQNSLGEEISNDPRWHAMKTLRDAGISFDQSQPEARQAAFRAAAADDADLGDDEETEPDVDENGARTYKELDGPALKKLATERGVDIKGLKKVGEVRDALRAADAAGSAQE